MNPAEHSLESPAASPGGVLTLGFGTTVAMWGVGYVGRLPFVQAPSPLVFLGLLGVLLLGGTLAGRRLPGGFASGARVGALAALLNLLVLGSVLGDHFRAVGGGALVSLVTVCVGSALLTGLAAAVAARGRPAPAPRDWSAPLALVAGCATGLLLAVGGLVTSHDAGLAVPDWPNTFGSNMFLYPLSRMTGGIYYEHAHRLFGALVGLATLALGQHVVRHDTRPWVRRLAILAVVLVIVQGLLGGLRVTGRPTLSMDRAELAPSTVLALVHGVLAQLFFTLILGLAAVTSGPWRAERPATPHPEAEGDLTLGAWLVGVSLLQLVLGALVRHFHTGVTWHVTGAVAVVLLACAGGVRARIHYGALPVLPRLGLALAGLVCLQLTLGIGALVTTSLSETAGDRNALEVPFTTAHQTLGAIVLALGVQLRLWSGRLLAPAEALPAERAEQAA